MFVKIDKKWRECKKYLANTRGRESLANARTLIESQPDTKKWFCALLHNEVVTAPFEQARTVFNHVDNIVGDKKLITYFVINYVDSIYGTFHYVSRYRIERELKRFEV